jgi:branched-chain amino acid transport system ATP-binding protein
MTTTPTQAAGQPAAQGATLPTGAAIDPTAADEKETAPRRSLLELSGVRSGYGQLEILKGIDLKVAAGEIVTLIGANGAGKTTTLNTICAALRTRAGSIILDGEEITDYPTDALVRRGLVQVPEGRKLFSEMTVQENLELGAYLRSDRAEIRADMEKMFGLFPRLRERRTQRAGSLSGGEQQMCAIARGLMSRPRLLLLDEPSLGLAPLLVEQIFDIVREINAEGVTVFLVEQNAHMALSVAHHGYVMVTGEITLAGRGRDLLANDDVRKMYLGEE